MPTELRAQLIPQGGGDVIPLLRDQLTIGRRESCDICLRFPNVSSLHCELTFRDGYWLIKDMGSTNGIKVNGDRVQEKVLRPKDEITIAKRRYVIEYDLASDRRLVEMEEMMAEEIFQKPLLERAGLMKPKREKPKSPSEEEMPDIDWDSE